MIWQVNVRYLSLIDEKVLKRALLVMLKGLFKDGKLARFNRTVQAYDSGSMPVGTARFPGFDLFTPDRSGAPYTWLLTKPNVDIATFLKIYEEFANRSLGDIRNPAKVASKIYGPHSESIKLFKGDRHESLWLSPAILLAAAAQHLGAEVESKGVGSVCLRLGPCMIEVTPRGCWSNIRHCIYPATTRGIVGDWPTTRFPDVVTTNPILTSFSEVSESLPHNTQYAACLLGLGLQEGTITDDWLMTQLIKQSTSIIRKGRLSPERFNLAVNALQRCDALLEENDQDLIPKLYQVLVPSLMGSRQFRSKFGPPTTCRAGRKARAETIQGWRDFIEDEFGRLRYANC